jgi:hypothetical protein
VIVVTSEDEKMMITSGLEELDLTLAARVYSMEDVHAGLTDLR